MSRREVLNWVGAVLLGYLAYKAPSVWVDMQFLHQIRVMNDIALTQQSMQPRKP